MNVVVLWLFLTVPWDGLQCVIVVFPDHAYLLFQRSLHFHTKRHKAFISNEF